MRNKGLSCVAALGWSAATLHLALERDQELLHIGFSYDRAGCWRTGLVAWYEVTKWVPSSACLGIPAKVCESVCVVACVFVGGRLWARS